MLTYADSFFGQVLITECVCLEQHSCQGSDIVVALWGAFVSLSSPLENGASSSSSSSCCHTRCSASLTFKDCWFLTASLSSDLTRSRKFEKATCCVCWLGSTLS